MTVETVWNDNREDAPKWHELSNSQRYLLTLMIAAVVRGIKAGIETLPAATVVGDDDRAIWRYHVIEAIDRSVGV